VMYIRAHLSVRCAACPTAADPRGSVVVPHVVDAVEADLRPAVGGVEHHSAADVQADVVDVGGRAVEHQVADAEFTLLGVHPGGPVLILRHAGQLDARLGVGGLHQAGAVEAAFRVGLPAPDVFVPQFGLGPVDGRDPGGDVGRLRH